jgi:hypothetical protein
VKIVAFCDIPQCSLISLMMDTGRASETSVYFNETALRCIPEDCNRDVIFFACEYYV